MGLSSVFIPGQLPTYPTGLNLDVTTSGKPSLIFPNLRYGTLTALCAKYTIERLPQVLCSGSHAQLQGELSTFPFTKCMKMNAQAPGLFGEWMKRPMRFSLSYVGEQYFYYWRKHSTAPSGIGLGIPFSPHFPIPRELDSRFLNFSAFERGPQVSPRTYLCPDHGGGVSKTPSLPQGLCDPVQLLDQVSLPFPFLVYVLFTLYGAQLKC